jgi:membrane protease YdiL (CAAX protease family)
MFNWAVFLRYLSSFFVFAAIEELINRGYLFQALCEGAGVWPAAILTSLCFSAVHVINPAFSLLGGLFLFVHGLLYAVAYLKTRSLWTPIGLHMAWNCCQGPLAGMNVSGTSVKHSFMSTTPIGPEWVTGGDFGIEGGVAAIVFSALVLAVLVKAKWLGPSGSFLEIERQWLDSYSDAESPVRITL